MEDPPLKETKVEDKVLVSEDESSVTTTGTWTLPPSSSEIDVADLLAEKDRQSAAHVGSYKVSKIILSLNSTVASSHN